MYFTTKLRSPSVISASPDGFSARYEGRPVSGSIVRLNAIRSFSTAACASTEKILPSWPHKRRRTALIRKLSVALQTSIWTPLRYDSHSIRAARLYSVLTTSSKRHQCHIIAISLAAAAKPTSTRPVPSRSVSLFFIAGAGAKKCQ